MSAPCTLEITMSDISKLLMQKAAEYRKALSASDSDNSWDLVKSAAISQLQAQGVSDAEKVLDELAKKAGLGETRSVANSFSFNTEEVISLIEKTAAYIDELQAKIESDEDTISSLHEEIEKAASIDKRDIIDALIERGFSEEEADSLTALPSETLSKVASLGGRDTPWEMGKGARQAEDSLDPFTKFLLN